MSAETAKEDWLSLEQAETLSAAVIRQAAEINIAISVAVVDPSGRVQHLARMDGAGWFSPDIALAKAVASAAFRADTADLVHRFQGRDAFTSSISSVSGGRLIIGSGGCVIRNRGSIVGAVGVSGATAEQDERCARAGVSSLSFEDSSN
jgi:uncharacterized protein GlcG (DUF336 family)